MRKPELEFHEPLADWQKTNGVTPRKDLCIRYVRWPTTWHASRTLPKRRRLSHARYRSSEVRSKHVISGSMVVE